VNYRIFVVSVATLVALFSASPVLAEDARGGDAIEVVGEADAGETNPRVAALDDAFAKAIKQTVASLTTEAQRKSHRHLLDPLRFQLDKQAEHRFHLY
jgi:hypothetical protein